MGRIEKKAVMEFGFGFWVDFWATSPTTDGHTF